MSTLRRDAQAIISRGLSFERRVAPSLQDVAEAFPSLLEQHGRNVEGHIVAHFSSSCIRFCQVGLAEWQAVQRMTEGWWSSRHVEECI